ncbi:hypothetical protein [Paenibacillus piri]|uniref:Uncharacterized protein n=1 Tax=Paenibacillus piri TaxID=2547395 RepID=A0A4R5KL57_9BACL|nr:hypothetical protein [Paenibacillus piri]TDF95912.1 hypothetical protein E1757_19520 [Paenibacillus piri]
MKKSTFWLVSLVIWTSLMVPMPLSNAAVTGAAISAAEAAGTTATGPKASEKPPAPVQPDSTITSPSLKDAVQQWIQSISGQQGFQAWKQAEWTSQPLGPGTHGWIVLLQSQGSPVGYMVIHAADPNNPSKFRLTEYGRGSTPLFSMQTLYQSLVQLDLINSSYKTERLYVDPLHAVWKITDADNFYYIDAKTGEVLPLQTDSDLQESGGSSADEAYTRLEPGQSIGASLQLPEFDPYDRLPWVKNAPAAYESFAALRSDLERHKKLTYTAQLYNGKVTSPFAVTGYHQWSGEDAFLLLEQNGQRAIPYAAACKLGKLYP